MTSIFLNTQAAMYQEDSVPQLAVLSATTETALKDQLASLREHLALAMPKLGDVAFTLQVESRQLPHRTALVCDSLSDLQDALAGQMSKRSQHVDHVQRRLIFVFPGAGVQYPGMGRELYTSEPVFREAVDVCRTLLRDLGADDVLPAFMASRDDEATAALMRMPRHSGVSVLVYQVAMLRLLKSIGIKPDLVLGHSLGEYACAVAANALSLRDALALMVRRGQLLETLKEPGAMLLVAEFTSALDGLLEPETVVTAWNGPQSTIVAGPVASIDALARRFETQGISYRRIRYGAASHCYLVEPMLPQFEAAFASSSPQAPRLPWISTVTAQRQPRDVVVDSSYWCRQFSAPVRFAEAVRNAAEEGPAIWIEIGPHNGLTNLLKANAEGATVVCFSQHASDPRDSRHPLLEGIGALWLHGVDIDWEALHISRQPRRIPLPTKVFGVAAGFSSGEPSKAPDLNPVFTTPAVSQTLTLDFSVTGERTPNDVEFIVRCIWQEMFGGEPISLDENFFDLGGHSLLAVRINSEIRALFQVELTTGGLFKNPTVRALASSLVAEGQVRGVKVEAIATTLREVSGMSVDELAELTAREREQTHAA
jgi:acyl transferase domain-containing protein